RRPQSCRRDDCSPQPGRVYRLWRHLRQALTTGKGRDREGGMSATRVCAQSIIDQGTFGTGLQLVVRQRGRVVLSESIGFARPALPITTESIQSVYCLTKPVVACAVCATADEVGVALDDDLRGVSPRLARLLGSHRITLRDVLSHRAGLHPMSAPEAMFLPA